MPLIKSLVQKIFKTPPVNNSDVDDHYTQLEYLHTHHELINVKVTQTEQVYQSLILSIDIENNELLIDDLYPPENTDQIDSGDTVEVFDQLSSKNVHFYTRILAKEVNDDGTCWRLELPTEIGRNQNRDAYRIYVEREQALDIELYYQNEPLLNVRIINLSTDGLKISFDHSADEILKNKPQFTDCIIRLPSGENIDCDLYLHNIYHIRTPTPHILAGGKLKIHNPQQRMKLQQYLASVQRQQRRRENRVN